MKSTQFLLIGGGLSCATAANRLREHDSQSKIVLVSQEAHAPYDRPPLTKDFMQGKTPQDKVFIYPPTFYQDNGIELLLGQHVERIDLARRVATLRRGESIGFDKALLATGGRPRRLDVGGESLGGVFHLHTLDDAIEISRRAERGRQAVIVGGGFLGMELACSLVQRGMSVQLVHNGEHIWSRFADTSLSKYLQDYCAARGVTFHLGQTVAAFHGNGQVSAALLTSGGTLTCDLAVIAVGIEPNIELAAQAGLTVDNGVLVDSCMTTSHPAIYAAGDIANYPDPHFNVRRRVEHWGQAQYTGMLAADNMAGQQRHYDLLTYVWSDLFDLHMEFAGDERQHDRIVTRGRQNSNHFAVFYLRGGRMTAFFAINEKKKQYAYYGKLIERKVDLNNREDLLRNENFDLSELLTDKAKK